MTILLLDLLPLNDGYGAAEKSNDALMDARGSGKGNGYQAVIPIVEKIPIQN